MTFNPDTQLVVIDARASVSDEPYKDVVYLYDVREIAIPGSATRQLVADECVPASDVKLMLQAANIAIRRLQSQLAIERTIKLQPEDA